MENKRIQRLWQLDPETSHAPWRAAPTAVERVLHIHLSTPEEPQGSLCRALASLTGPGGYRRVDWTGLAAHDRHRVIVEAAAALQPTLIFMQLQGPGVLSPATVKEMRSTGRASGLVIVCWCGDVGGANGPFPHPGDQWAYELSPHCDLMLYASMSQVRAHRSRGMHNASYLQIGYDEDRYFEGNPDEYGIRYDIVFLGTNYNGSNPGFTHADVLLRRRIVEALQKEFAARFGLFGRGWGPRIARIPSAESGQIYRLSHMALNISISSCLERYSSDRLFRALACGTAVLMKTFDDWPSLGLIHGQNVLAWNTVHEAIGLARVWLNGARGEELREIGRRGAKLAREHHSWASRVPELYPLIANARGTELKVNRPW